MMEQGFIVRLQLGNQKIKVFLPYCPPDDDCFSKLKRWAYIERRLFMIMNEDYFYSLKNCDEKK